MNGPAPSVHASCVLIGRRGVLIRGPSGAGKSRLALRLIQAAERGDIPFARLVSDDRTLLETRHGRLLARSPAPLAGLIEIRGKGIERVTYEPVCVVGLVVDLAAAGERLPRHPTIDIDGVAIPALAMPAGADPLPLVLENARAA